MRCKNVINDQSELKRVLSNFIVIIIHVGGLDPRPQFSKRTDILPQDLGKSRRREIRI